MKLHIVGLVLVLSAFGCQEKKADPVPRAQPKPLEPLERVVLDAGDDREKLFQVAPFTPTGPAVPSGVTSLALAGDVLPKVPPSGAVMLVADEDTYLSQIAPLLEQLDDAGREVWLKHPDLDVAYRVKLRDAASFQAWIDEPVPGKFRVIHRADGFELQTNLGKLPGGDPNGPTVPVRGGKLDMATLRRGFERIQNKFRSAPDVCFAPSYGMEIRQVARAIAANYLEPDVAYFESVCLVYPRQTRPVDKE